MEYKIAQICLNGHTLSINYEAEYRPDRRCTQCGAKTIIACPSCNAPIHGGYIADIVFSNGFSYERPAYCHECGEPYPWTKTAIQNANAFIDENMPELTPKEQADFKARVPDIMFETSETPLSSMRISKYLKKVSAIAQEGFKHNLFGVTLEIAKRLIWPA